MIYPKNWQEESLETPQETSKQEEFETKTCKKCGIQFETAKNAEPICSGCWLEEHKKEEHV